MFQTNRKSCAATWLREQGVWATLCVIVAWCERMLSPIVFERSSTTYKLHSQSSKHNFLKDTPGQIFDLDNGRFVWRSLPRGGGPAQTSCHGYLPYKRWRSRSVQSPLLANATMSRQLLAKLNGRDRSSHKRESSCCISSAPR